VPELKDLWIDIAAKDRDEARQAVAVGDPVTFELGLRRFAQTIWFAAPGIDNKVGGLGRHPQPLELVAGKKSQSAVYARLDGAGGNRPFAGRRPVPSRIDAQIGIAVDVTHATDCPTLDAKQYGDINLGGRPGPVPRPQRQPGRPRETDATGRAE